MSTTGRGQLSRTLAEQSTTNDTINKNTIDKKPQGSLTIRIDL